MIKHIKERWLDALRSGEYEQGTGSLVYEDHGKTRFCCLGVLTNLYVEETGDKDVWEREGAILESKVMEWASIEENPSIQEGEYGCLASANDFGASFDTIANLITTEL